MPNLYSIGLFPPTGTYPTIPSTEVTVITTGWSIAGIGAETYAYDAALVTADALANPRTMFEAVDGRIFKLAPMSKPLATAFGALVHATRPSTAIEIDNSEAIQAAMRWGPFLLPPGTIWCDPGTPIIPWALGEGGAVYMEGTGIKGVTRSSLIRFVVPDGHARPCIFIPEAYIDGETNELKNADGTLHEANGPVGPPTGRQVIFKNVALSATYGKFATVMFLLNTSNNYFEDCTFNSTHRGLMDVSSFNTVFTNCGFTGLYYSAGRTLAEIEANFRESYGLYITGHFTMINSSVTGWGVGVSCGGPGSTIMNTRMEVGECAIRVGGAINYYWSYWNGTSWNSNQRLVANSLQVDACSFESNRWGVIVDNATGSEFSKLTVTGSAGAVPLGRAPAAGVVVGYSVPTSTVFDNCSITVQGTIYGPVINAGTAEWRRSTAVRGAQAAWSATDGRWRITQSVPNQFKDAALPATRSTITCDSQTALRGITGFDGANALVFSNNVGAQNVPVTTASATSAVLFPTARGVGTAQFTSGTPLAVPDLSSTLPPATYWYATTIVGRRGETGVNWQPLYEGSLGTDLTYKKVTVAAGEKVELRWNTAVGYLRRLYRGTKSGYFDGFWEVDGSSTLPFYDDGTKAFDGKDFPPGINGVVPAQTEVDANYGIVVTPSWNTSYWITGKATTGFTVNFGTPAPAGATFDWLLYRG